MDEQKNNPNADKMDYDKIYDLYEISKEDNKDRIRRNLKRWLKKYIEKEGISAQTYYDMNEMEQIKFIAFEIKEKMLSEHPDTHIQKKVQKNIDDYVKNSLYKAKMLLKLQNESLKNIHDTPNFRKGDKNSEENAYKKFCTEWNQVNSSLPPSYETFVSNPHLSIYDYMKNMETEHQEDFAYFEFERHETQSIIMSIILKVLKDLIGLEIDYEEIKDCIENLYSLNSLDYDWDLLLPLPDTVEEYIKEATWKPITTYKRNGKTVKPVQQIGENGKESTIFVETNEENKELQEKEHLKSETSKSKDSNWNDWEITTTYIKDDSYTEEDIEKMKEIYKKVRLNEEKRMFYQNKLRDLTDLYKVDEEKIKKLQVKK